MAAMGKREVRSWDRWRVENGLLQAIISSQDEGHWPIGSSAATDSQPTDTASIKPRDTVPISMADSDRGS